MNQNADYIKIKLLDRFIKKYKKNVVFANELLFSKNKRRADLVCLTKKLLTAFEIKSGLDNTSRLKEQIDDYVKTFDKVFIVTVEKNLNQIYMKVKNNNAGIILYNYNKNFKVVRKAERNIPNKQDLLYLLDRNTLLKELRLKGTGRNESIDVIRNMAMAKRELKLQSVKKISRTKLYLRYNLLFQLFIKDKSDNFTTYDDLLNLTGSVGRLR